MSRRTLLLLRHAEAAPAKPAQADRERPITPRGRTHATAVGRQLAQRGLLPELAVSSDARRAVETLTVVLQQLDRRPRQLVAPEIYSAEEHDLLSWIRRSGGTAGTILMVGHNPSIQAFAAWMADDEGTVSSTGPRSGYPPATLAAFDTAASAWSEFDPARAGISLFLVPGGR